MEWETIFNEADTNKDGVIDFDEFVALIYRGVTEYTTEIGTDTGVGVFS